MNRREGRLLNDRWSTAAPYARRHKTLAQRFDPKSNSVWALRLGLALVVAISHASAIAAGRQVGFGPQPKEGMAELGDLAVDAFFVLSGFLVTISYQRLNSVPRFLWHRFLRVMPAFWVCLLLTALVFAPLISVGEGRAPLSVFPEAFGYVVTNGALHMSDFSVAGLPTGTNQPGIVNGALWTLYYEAACYVALALMGTLGLLQRFRHLTLVLLVSAWLTYAADVIGILQLPMPLGRRFLLLFLAGACARLYDHRLPMSGKVVMAAALVTTGSVMSLPDYRAVGALPFAYVVLWAVISLPCPWQPSTDLSYGLYIFHWPIESILATYGLAALGFPAFTIASLAIAALLALASWHWIERPALALKSAQPPWHLRT